VGPRIPESKRSMPAIAANAIAVHCLLLGICLLSPEHVLVLKGQINV